MKRKFVICPECDGEIEVSESAHVGDIVSCDECEREFEVVSRKPVKLKLSDAGDEYDDDEEDYEDDENR
jgi:lysine biosynthesis protein LysW